MPQPITEYQFQKVREEIKKHKNKFIAKRNCLMYEIAYYLGFRPMEVRCMQVSHINFQEKTIFIPAENNKERHEDDFPVPDFLLEKILIYLRKREIKSKWLFPCYWNEIHKQDIPVDARTHQKSFFLVLKKLGFIHLSYIDKQGIPRYNLTLYSFRHHFATNAYRKFNNDVKKTANLMRHYDIQFKSTLRYIHVVEKEQRRELINELFNKKEL